MVYEWKEGAHMKLDAQTIGEHLESLARADALTPEVIVEDAKGKLSPTHEYFDWNDTQAAHKYRLVQARELARAVVVVIDRPEVTLTEIRVRAFSSLKDEGVRQYVETTMAFDDEGLRRQLLASAQRELKAFKVKYARLTELAEILAAIDTLKLEFA